MSCDSVESGEFTVPKREILMRMTGMFAVKQLTIIAIAVILCIIAGCFYDLRLIIVALMLSMIILPGIAAYLYFSYGLRPECFVNILPHTVAFDTHEVTVTLFIAPYKDNDKDNAEDEEVVIERRTVGYTFPIDKSRPYSVSGSAICVNLAPPYKGFVYVPYSAFDTPERFRIAIDLLRNETDKR